MTVIIECRLHEEDIAGHLDDLDFPHLNLLYSWDFGEPTMSETGTDTEHVLSNLPLWKCHKVVRAAPMRAVYAADHEAGWNVYFDGVEASVFIGPGVFSRYMPVPGDYLVVYDDGYISVSSKKSFEECCSPMEACT